jgi:hypothetical protein
MALHKLLAFISPKWREPSECESCGDPFVCGASLMGCWCLKTKLSDSTRAELRAKYKRCLCQSCLQRFAAQQG